MLLPVPWCVGPQQMDGLRSPKAAGKQPPPEENPVFHWNVEAEGRAGEKV